MIYLLSFEKVCRGNVLDAFRGQAAVLCSQSQQSAALQGIKENNKKKKKQISKPNREMITLLSASCDISQS